MTPDALAALIVTAAFALLVAITERACAGLDTEAWFPETGSESQKSARRAKKICAYCVVHDDCLEYALNAYPRVFGIWGGTTERDRVEMRLQRKAMA